MRLPNTAFSRRPAIRAAALALAGLALVGTIPAAAQYRQAIGNDMSQCHRGSGPAVMVTVDGVKSSTGRIRVQSYRGTASDWLQKGKWINRIEMPARAGTMTFCLPVPAAGKYAVAVRHDVDGSGGTNIRTDGGGMSNNPAINIFNLGKPGVSRTAFAVGNDVTSIRILMRYM